MKRKPKAGTVDGAVRAMRNVVADPMAPPWPLTAAQKPVWDEILLRRARDEWQPVDLRFAAELARVIVELRREDSRLSREGFIIDGDKGPKQNPRAIVTKALSARGLALARYLRIHPGSDYHHASMVRGIRDDEQAAREAAPFDEVLLPVH